MVPGLNHWTYASCFQVGYFASVAVFPPGESDAGQTLDLILPAKHQFTAGIGRESHAPTGPTTIADLLPVQEYSYSYTIDSSATVFTHYSPSIALLQRNFV